MRKLKLKLYERQCKRYMRLWKKAMDGMEKHMFDMHNAKFMKYAGRNYKYRVKFEDIKEKRNRLLKTWY